MKSDASKKGDIKKPPAGSPHRTMTYQRVDVPRWFVGFLFKSKKKRLATWPKQNHHNRTKPTAKAAAWTMTSSGASSSPLP
jgi:hypothetical protein